MFKGRTAVSHTLIAPLILSCAFALLLALFGASTPPAAQAVSTNLVISQIYGGGGNSGAIYKNDFVELYNLGSAPVSVAGWSVQYASATGKTWQVTPLSGSIDPGRYYLVQEAAGSGGTVNLPTPDATGTIPMSATTAKVALVNTTTALTCGSLPNDCLPNPTIIDFVGYGTTANSFEGSGPAPAPSNTTADLRGSSGCTETDNNANDFAVGAPNPRNSASPASYCGPTGDPSGIGAANPATAPLGGSTLLMVTVTPGTNPPSTGITVAADLTGIGGPASQSFFDDGTHGDVTPNDNVFSFQATIPQNIATCSKTLPATIADEQGRSANANIALNVVIAPSSAIHDIQGAAHISPLNGQCVAGVAAVVTALTKNGFYMEDPQPDGDISTSEGIFVFTSKKPTVQVGDAVTVEAKVSEFRPGGSGSTNLTTTELSGPTVKVTSSGNSLPTPVVLGTGGRVPPATVIEDDATGDVETTGVFDPATDGIDFYESLEGMLVQVNDAVAVGPWHNFGSNREIPVVGDNGANATVRTYRGGVVLRSGDSNPERIIFNDLIVGGPTLPSVNLGDGFPGATIGVMDYSFGNFKLEVTSLPAVNLGGLAREVANPAHAYQLAVSTFNVENLAPSDPPAKFSNLAGLIVNNLRSPDLLAIEEIQDNSGAIDDGVVDASTTWSMLIAAIQAAGGPNYDYRQIDPLNDQDGGAPGGNIRQGFLFRTDRGLAFVDHPGGTSTDATGVTGSGGATELTFSPGRIDPANSAFNSSRKPLAGEFTFKGDKLFIVANHFNSKSGDQPLFGHFQPPTFSSEVQRAQQAQVVHDFVDSLSLADPIANIIVLGDLNDFQFSNALSVLKGNLLNNLVDTLPEDHRYSYDFDGNSEVLDQILTGMATFARPFVYQVVHVNSEFADQSSDHEPQVANICVDATPPSLTVTVSPDSLWPPNHEYVTVKATVQASDNADPNPTVKLVSVTSSEADEGLGDGDQPNDIVIVDDYTFRLRAERSGSGPGRTYTITYQATDACGNSVTATAAVFVPHDQGHK